LLRRALTLSIVWLLILPANRLRAETVEVPSRGFSIEPSQDWIELPLPFQGVVVSYGKKGTLATFHITERDLDEDETAPIPINRSKAEIGAVLTTVDQKKTKVRTVEQLKWEDLFSPEFGSIDIRTQNVTLLGGEKAKFCVYTLKPGEFKRTMEGKFPAKYINYVLIHRGKLFSITFRDTEDGFALTYPSFLAVIRTLRFDAAKPVPPGKPV
jgi:hypothetical protein